MSYYTGNITNTPSTIAVLPAPYYWWEAGALWGAMLDYFHYTGDDSYNAVTIQALTSQVGPQFDYMMPDHVKDEGNDDQAFWGFTTMSAAEKGYPEPNTYNSSIPYTWLQLTENLWNSQVRRWDTSTCGGGLRWQIFTFNNGYDYKNSVSNGAFFQLSARLARFTGNSTYLDWALKSYDWATQVGLVGPTYSVSDGTATGINCTQLDRITWTYSHGIYLYGSAVMYNYTNGSELWQSRTYNFLEAAGAFFSPYSNATDIMFENACEEAGTCDNDQFSFKGYLARFMWDATIMAAFTKPAISAVLSTSALAAAKTCTAGSDGVACGQKWYVGGYDGNMGIGQQMSALEVVQGLLVGNSSPPMYNNKSVHIAVVKVTSSVSSITHSSTSTTTETPTQVAATQLSTNTLTQGASASTTAASSSPTSDKQTTSASGRSSPNWWLELALGASLGVFLVYF